MIEPTTQYAFFDELNMIKNRHVNVISLILGCEIPEPFNIILEKMIKIISANILKNIFFISNLFIMAVCLRF